MGSPSFLPHQSARRELLSRGLLTGRCPLCCLRSSKDTARGLHELRVASAFGCPYAKTNSSVYSAGCGSCVRVSGLHQQVNRTAALVHTFHGKITLRRAPRASSYGCGRHISSRSVRPARITRFSEMVSVSKNGRHREAVRSPKYCGSTGAASDPNAECVLE